MLRELSNRGRWGVSEAMEARITGITVQQVLDSWTSSSALLICLPDLRYSKSKRAKERWARAEREAAERGLCLGRIDVLLLTCCLSSGVRVTFRTTGEPVRKHGKWWMNAWAVNVEMGVNIR